MSGGGMPHNWETERALLGCVLLAPQTLAEARAVVDAADFARPQHAALWSFLCRLADEGRPSVDMVVLLDILGEGSGHSKMERFGGAAYVVALPQACPTVDHVVHYAERVRHQAQKRALLTRFQGAIEALQQPDTDLSALAGSMAEATRGMARTGRTWRTLGSGAREAYEHAIEASETGIPPERFTTGILELDDLLTVRRKDLVVVAGRPGSGKSLLTQQIAEHVGRYHGAVALFNLEMTNARMGGRAMARESGVPSGRIQHGVEITKTDRSKMMAALTDIEKQPVYVDDHPHLSMEILRAQAEAIRRERPDLCALVVDYLQLMHMPGDKGETQALRVGRVTRSAKLLAKELDVALYLVSQLNRAPEGRESKEPTAADLRDSGAIEQDADSVVLIWRGTNAMSGTRGKAKVKVAKQREGAQGTIEVAFDGAYARFGEPRVDAKVYQFDARKVSSGDDES